MLDGLWTVAAVLGALRTSARVKDDRAVAVFQAGTALPAFGTHGAFIAPRDDKTSLPRGRLGRLSPAQLVQPVVVDAEVVGDLVDDGDRHLVDDLLLRVALLQ
jgi:hypothetical protein